MLKNYFKRYMKVVWLGVVLSSYTRLSNYSGIYLIPHTSDFPKDHPMYSLTNKKVLGKMKDKRNGMPITECVCLRPKMYSILTEKKTWKRPKIRKSTLSRKKSGMRTTKKPSSAKRSSSALGCGWTKSRCAHLIQSEKSQGIDNFAFGYRLTDAELGDYIMIGEGIIPRIMT